MVNSLTSELSRGERQTLLRLARRSVEAAASNRPLPKPDAFDLSPALTKPSACFVTLFEHSELRGCTGVLAARQPLVYEVIQTAAQTACFDPRFAPVMVAEVAAIEIEISILSNPCALTVPAPETLPQLIRPRIDGVTLYHGQRRATFLPQVWEKIPDPVEFLNRLCEKMGLPARSWLQPGMAVEVYQVQEFSDKDDSNR